jgi:SAM-dependent methyltransferase
MTSGWTPIARSARMSDSFPLNYNPGGGEAAKSYRRRAQNSFFDKYFSGKVVLDIGFAGAGMVGKPIVPHAVGIDRGYPGYDGLTLPFDDLSVDCVSSSHCLEHLLFREAAIREWYRVLKVGGFIACFVPHRDLYEKRRFPPSRFNRDHKVFFTSSSLLALFEATLQVNAYRVRHLNENDAGFDYSIGPDQHSAGCYEIELVIEKIAPPAWQLA